MVGHNYGFRNLNPKIYLFEEIIRIKSQFDIINANLVIKNKLQVGNLGCL